MDIPELDSDLYGSSKLRSETSVDISRIYHAQGSTAMPLGHNENSRTHGLVFDAGPEGTTKGHALTFGRTRGGKGVSAIIPALLTYSGSMVVIDPKGENAWITAERRRQMGQRVVILDPWDEVNKRYGSKVGVTETVTRFNPLSALDPDDPDFGDDVSSIAEAFIVTVGNDPHWSDSARELVAGLIASEVQANPGIGSMREVRRLITLPLAALKTAVENSIKEFSGSLAANKLAAVVEVDEKGAPLSPREMGSIRSVARTQTAFLDSARLQESMETDDPPFNLADLATDKVTLYLVLPVDRLKSHGRWLRLILTLAIRAISKQSEPPAIPVVFMLDELGTISPGSGLSMIEQSYGLMAGLGIRIWAFLQDLPQLKRDYHDSWETFISNSSVIQLLNVADGTTSKYFAEQLGNNTVNSKTGGWSYKQVRWADPEEYQRELNKRIEKSLAGTKAFHRQKYGPEWRKYNWEIQHKCDVIRSPRPPYLAASDPWPEVEYQYKRPISGHFSPNKPLWPEEPPPYLVEQWRNEAKRSFEQQIELESHVTADYRMEWVPDEQLAARPVMFPWEVVDADDSKSIIIIPGKEKAQLKRFVYYTDPVFSKWARPDPKQPPAVIAANDAEPQDFDDSEPLPPPPDPRRGPRFDTQTGKRLW